MVYLASRVHDITSGVPQGTVLGLLIFISSIDNLPAVVNSVEVLRFVNVFFFQI